MNYYYITGTSSGIGKAIAEELLKQKSNFVIGISRKSSINAPNYQHLHLDLSNAIDIPRVKFEEHDDAKKIILLNNAATLGDVRHLGQLNEYEIEASFTVNVIAPAVLMNNFIKAYQEHSAHKMIINVTSGAAQSPYDGWSVYCASKAALDMLTRVAVKEQELKNEKRVRVMAIAPGVVNTNMQSQIRQTDKTGFSRKEKFIELYEENELYDPADVAKAFLKIMEHPDEVKEVIQRIEL